MVFFTLTGLYLTFAVLMLRRQQVTSGGELCTGQGMAFIQVLLISGVNAVACAIYVFMQFFPSQISAILIYTATYTWVLVHGMPPVIYLALNKTIRGECLAMMRWKTRESTMIWV